MIYVKTKSRRHYAVHAAKALGTGLELGCGRVLEPVATGWRNPYSGPGGAVFAQCDGPATCKNCLSNKGFVGAAVWGSAAAPASTKANVAKKNPRARRKTVQRSRRQPTGSDSYIDVVLTLAGGGGLRGGFGAGVRRTNKTQTERPKRNRNFRLKTNPFLIAEPFGSDLELTLGCFSSRAILADFGAAAGSYFKIWRPA